MGFLGTGNSVFVKWFVPPSHSIITTLARSYIKHRREDLEDGHFAVCPSRPLLLTQLAGISRQRCLIITGLVIIVGMQNIIIKMCQLCGFCPRNTNMEPRHRNEWTFKRHAHSTSNIT